MRQRIRRLGVWQMAKVMGVLYLLIGAVIAVVFAAIAAMGLSELTGTRGFGPGMGARFLIGMPLLYSAIGLVAGACIAALYNFTARWTGGIEMETGSMEIEPV